MKFTRSRICLAVGIATNGGNTTDVFSTLKRNNSIIEQGREIWMNPDLYIVDYFTKKGEPPDETILHTIDSASCRRVHADQLLLE